MPVIAIRWWAAAGLLAVASVQAGCGSDDPPAAAARATRSATAAPRASVPRDVSGSWERRVSARDWRRAGGGFPPGTWRFDVDAKGSVDVYLPGTTSADFSTRFAVAGHRVTIQPVPVCPSTRARYAWRATARTLTLTVAGADGCAPRAALFGGTWRRRH